jgi:hypothetical protein
LPPKKSPQWYVGHYGCNNRLVKLKTWYHPGYGIRAWPPKEVHLKCPSCQEKHPASVWWRTPKREREMERAELEVKQ